jgi:hypothetical protein
MKKIVLSLVVMSALLICSCNFSKKASNASEAADSLNVQPTEVVDSVVVADTVAVDSVVAE